MMPSVRAGPECCTRRPNNIFELLAYVPSAGEVGTYIYILLSRFFWEYTADKSTTTMDPGAITWDIVSCGSPVAPEWTTDAHMGKFMSYKQVEFSATAALVARVPCPLLSGVLPSC